MLGNLANTHCSYKANTHGKLWAILTLVLGAETSQLVVAVGGEMQSEPVLAADDGRGQVGASEPDKKDTEEEENRRLLATNFNLPMHPAEIHYSASLGHPWKK